MVNIAPLSQDPGFAASWSRYGYQPPRGWRRVESSWDTTWLAPEWPRRRASIIVDPAVAISVRGTAPPPTPRGFRPGTHLEILRTAHGLRGERWSRLARSPDGEFLFQIATVWDHAYDYTVRLIAPRGNAADEVAFDTLIHSIEPLAG